MCVAVRRWTGIVPEKETVAPLSSATDSTRAACRRRELPTTGGVQGEISDNTRMLHRRGSHTRVKSTILGEKELLTVMWRDGLNSLERTENLASKGENPQGKGKLKQFNDQQVREVLSHWVNGQNWICTKLQKTNMPCLTSSQECLWLQSKLPESQRSTYFWDGEVLNNKESLVFDLDS